MERDFDYGIQNNDDSDSDPDYGSGAKRKGKKKKAAKSAAATTSAPKTAPAPRRPSSEEGGIPAGEDGEHDLSITGRRKRKDTGQTRTVSRAWTDDEEKLFLEGLALHGRDWKKCAEHVGSRDHRAIASHAQKFLIKALLKGEELPGKMVDSGRGYTLSGKPLDPNCSSARSYGLKPDLFQKIVETGFLQVGIHVTTLEMTEGPPSKAEPKPPAPPASKRPRKSPAGDSEKSPNGKEAAGAGPGARSPPAAVPAAPAEPTEYAKNRPRRQLPSAKAQLGATTESLDLTLPCEFVGPIATGAPLSQPFSVTLSSEALLVMDFHAHLSTCEVIGLLGGQFDPISKAIAITAAYPCRRAEGSHSSTSVELDAESQVEVACDMEDRGLVPVGWYHSHPVFEPRPSAKDNENQRNYQALCRDPATGLEPWIGAIVGPYDQMLPSAASLTQLWVVRQQNRELSPYNIRHVRTPPTIIPEQGGHLEQQLITALENTKDDTARVNPMEIWRPYARLVQGTAEGGPLTIGEKLQLALRVHLPRDQSGAVAEFMDRLRGHFKDVWGVNLPALVVSGPPAPADDAGLTLTEGNKFIEEAQQPLEVKADGGDAVGSIGRVEGGEEPARIGHNQSAPTAAAAAGGGGACAIGEQTSALDIDESSPEGTIKAEQVDPNNRAADEET